MYHNKNEYRRKNHTEDFEKDFIFQFNGTRAYSSAQCWSVPCTVPYSELRHYLCTRMMLAMLGHNNQCKMRLVHYNFYNFSENVIEFFTL